MSLKVVAGASVRTMQTLGSTYELPSQLNSRRSNCTPSTPVNWLITCASWKRPITVPSFDAALNMWFAATRPPPPGMFWTMTTGAPGMCLPIWRDTRRAVVSKPPPAPEPTMMLTVLRR